MGAFMIPKNAMSISEFARFSGIKRANLIFYDKIGLLSPEYRGENQYRYYANHQLNSAYLIVSLRELGLSIDEIKKYSEHPTPEGMTEMFKVQEERIIKEISKLNHLRDIMDLHVEIVNSSLMNLDANKINKIQIIEKEKEPIFLGSPVDPMETEDQWLASFYNDAERQEMSVGYPLGVIISKDIFEQKNIIPIMSYYFRVKQGFNTYKPSGKYAVAYGHCPYGHSEEVYERLFRFIKEQGYTSSDQAYEEYPLNELSMKREEDYLVRVEIRIE